MLLYPDEAGWAYNHKYEPTIVEWVKENVKPGMVCVDAGANQGFYTLLFKRLGSRVYAFEPNETEAHKLFQNLRLNKTMAMVVVQALGSKIEERSLKVVSRKASRGSFGVPPDEVGKVWKEQLVDVITLDQFMEGKKKIDILKIDVEGAELEVLEGAYERIQADRPSIIIEIADVATRQFGYQAQYLLLWLKKLNYKVETSFKTWHRETIIVLP